MAKTKLFNQEFTLENPDGTPLINPANLVPAIKGIKPTGSQILIEMLTVQELANTPITISDKTDLKVPLQGYVRATGPGYRPDDWGFKVGDRVLISGTGVPAPNFSGNSRDSFLMEPYAIRSVLLES